MDQLTDPLQPTGFLAQDPAPPGVLTGVEREAPEVDPARKAAVNRWLDRVKQAKKHFEPDFTRMREDMSFAAGKQWTESTVTDDPYVVNLVLRHINNKTASLYAKNPTFTARPRKLQMFQVWDGEHATLQQAEQAAIMAMQQGMSPDAMSQAILADNQSGILRSKLLDRLSKTIELVLQAQIDQMEPDFKSQMKQLVRRTITVGVGYVKLGFQRASPRTLHSDLSPDAYDGPFAALKRLGEDIVDGEINTDEADASTFADLSAADGSRLLVQEGLTFDFPEATKIIPDPCCRRLDGFIGANWVAEEFILPPERIQEVYGVDVKSGATAYRVNGNDSITEGYDASGYATEYDRSHDSRNDKAGDRVVVYEVYDRKTGLVYTLCEGWPDYLEEPRRPTVSLKRFFPFFPLAFNEIEQENRIFPPSDARLMRPIQKEYNRAREEFRQHRIANRPGYAVAADSWDQTDDSKLTAHPTHAIVKLRGLRDGQKLSDLIQPIPKIGIDQNLYMTNQLMDDSQVVVGSQAANFGDVSGVTATETTIAESRRTTALGSNADDLDQMLTALGRAAAQVCLAELSPDTVKRCAGPGAAWPTFSAQEIADEILIEVRAGSSGRPNRAAEIASFERVAPVLLQIPGINPEFLAREALSRLDDRMDITEAYIPGLPSIVASNAAKQPGRSGDAGSDPNQQGDKGAQNAPQGPGHVAGPRPQPPHPNALGGQQDGRMVA